MALIRGEKSTTFGLAIIFVLLFTYIFVLRSVESIKDPVLIGILLFAGVVELFAISNKWPHDTLSQILWKLTPLFPTIAFAFGWVYRDYFGSDPTQGIFYYLAGHFFFQTSELYAKLITVHGGSPQAVAVVDAHIEESR